MSSTAFILVQTAVFSALRWIGLLQVWLGQCTGWGGVFSSATTVLRHRDHTLANILLETEMTSAKISFSRRIRQFKACRSNTSKSAGGQQCKWQFRSRGTLVDKHFPSTITGSTNWRSSETVHKKYWQQITDNQADPDLVSYGVRLSLSEFLPRFCQLPLCHWPTACLYS